MNTLSPDIEKPAANFNELVISKWPTGSNYICSPPVEDTDIDYVVFVKGTLQSAKAYLHNEGWNLCGKEYDEGSTEWFAMRKGKDNYIVMNDQERFSKWVNATELAKKLNLTNKDHRILLFNTIIDGMTHY